MGINGKKGLGKILMLLFIICLPVFVYLFLQGFGKNHYSVPVFYENGLPPDTAECISQYRPHKIDLQSVASFDNPGVSESIHFKLAVVDIDMDPDIRLGIPGYSLNRVLDAFTNNPSVQFIIIRPRAGVIPVKQPLSTDRVIYSYGTPEGVTGIAKCGLVLLDFPGDSSVISRRFVLVDEKDRIRGYYQVDSFEEIDRLILEMKIILKEEF